MEEALSLLIEQFSSIPLSCILVQRAIFCHLGTVSELLELVMSCSDSSLDNKKYAQYKYKALCVKYGLHPSACSVVDSDSDTSDLHSGCLINSFIDGSGLIGARSVIEHSVLLGSYNIGTGSIVSHLDATFGRDLTLGDAQVLQFVSLLDASSDLEFKISSILMHFGVADDIKTSFSSGKATLFGRNWNDIFQVSKYYDIILAKPTIQLFNKISSVFDRCIISVLLIYGPISQPQFLQLTYVFGMLSYFRLLTQNSTLIARVLCYAIAMAKS
jgi:hypothetical protein